MLSLILAGFRRTYNFTVPALRLGSLWLKKYRQTDVKYIIK